MVVYRKHSASSSASLLDYLDYRYADEYSKFTQKREMKYAYNPKSSSISAICSVTYYIDGNEVDEHTFNEVMVKIQNGYEIRTNKISKFQRVEDGVSETTWKLNVEDDKMKPRIWDFLNEQAELSNRYSSQDVEKALREMFNDHFKSFGGIDMNKNITITNYKYDEKTATTTIWWSDKTQTSVTADNVSEATEFEGYCAACAKKLFGNKSTYLNQFDKWTVKIPARQKVEAEKKAAEDKAREEARAKRAAKKAERKAKRDIEIRAKQLADIYYAQEIEDEAEKIAHEKYGVPKNWFDGYSED